MKISTTQLPVLTAQTKSDVEDYVMQCNWIGNFDLYVYIWRTRGGRNLHWFHFSQVTSWKFYTNVTLGWISFINFTHSGASGIRKAFERVVKKLLYTLLIYCQQWTFRYLNSVSVSGIVEPAARGEGRQPTAG